MNILEARRRLLDGEIKKRTAEAEDISVRSVARMRPGLTLYGKSEQETTIGAQLLDVKILTDLEVSIVKYFPVEVGNGSFTLSSNTPTESSTYNLFLLPGNVNNGASSQLNGVGEGMSRTVAAENRYVTIGVRKFSGNMNNPLDYNIMLNFGTTALPWEPYTGGAPSPSPAYPQEIKSMGDSGTINVTLSDGGSQSQILPVQTPNGLSGIPVDSGGNYTDADGQQWVCDEVDFKRGVYVQRVKERLYGENENVKATGFDTVYTIEQDDADYSVPVMSNTFIYLTNYQNSINFVGISDYSDSIVFGLSWITEKNTEAAKAWFAQKYAEGKPVKVLYILATPIETPLSPSELSAYAALRTYSPTTVVSNDAGTWMKLGYKTKKIFGGSFA